MVLGDHFIKCLFYSKVVELKGQTEFFIRTNFVFFFVFLRVPLVNEMNPQVFENFHMNVMKFKNY